MYPLYCSLHIIHIYIKLCKFNLICYYFAGEEGNSQNVLDIGYLNKIYMALFAGTMGICYVSTQ